MISNKKSRFYKFLVAGDSWKVKELTENERIQVILGKNPNLPDGSYVLEDKKGRDTEDFIKSLLAGKDYKKEGNKFINK